ncbi:MAG: ABC transporter ATP-binding protein [Thermoleophilia bacterium]|nr:ABC transporter ATP-binding protein [Thermoleophilia bacterium]
MLELIDVCAQAGSFKLRNVSFEVAQGESHVLLGPSGAGKSTLLEAIIGLRPLTSGKVLFEGRDLARIPPEKRDMGYLPQHLDLFPHLTVRDNILYGPRSRRVKADEYEPAVQALIEATGIGALLDRRPGTLSGGERQRVALVRALAARPRLLLLDEPFAALNESLRHELWHLLKNLQKEYGFAVLMITHDLTEGFFIGDRVSVLIDGEIKQTGDRETVWRSPATLSVAEYLGIRNLFPGKVINSTHEAVVVNCPALGGEILANKRPGIAEPVPGQVVHLGIRAEFVALRNEDHPPKPEELVLHGQFTGLTAAGTDVTLLFEPEDSDTVLEIAVNRRLLRRFGIRVGQPVTVALARRDLLLFTG